MPVAEDTGQAVAYALQLAIGLVLVLSAGPKVMRPRGFAAVVADYDVLPAAATRTAAALVIVVEVVLAAAFLAGMMLGVAVPVAITMLLVFGAVTAVNLRRGRDIPCGCFGGFEERISTRSLARVSLLLLAVLLLGAGLLTGEVEAVSPAQAVTDQDEPVAAAIDLASMAVLLLIGAMWLLSALDVRATVRGPASGAPRSRGPGAT